MRKPRRRAEYFRRYRATHPAYVERDKYMRYIRTNRALIKRDEEVLNATAEDRGAA